MSADGDSALLRAALVAELRARGVVRTDSVADAFAAVPRERFIPEVRREQGLPAVYRDEVFVTKHDARGMPLSSSSQPAIMAEMLELLAAAPGHRVLEIGTGTGYNAALLARLVAPAGHVTSVDIDPQLAKRALAALRSAGASDDVEVIVGDGRAGVGDGAPYDRIIVTACADHVCTPWMAQLTEGGRIVVPLRLDADPDAIQAIPALERHGSALRSLEIAWGGFMPLHGGDGGWGTAPARLAATRLVSGASRPLASVTGAGLERVSESAARALLAGLLAAPRTPRARGFTPLARGRTPLILIFLRSAIAPRRRVWVRAGQRHGIGVVDTRGRSLAAIWVSGRASEPASRRPMTARWRMDGYGAGSAACDELLALLAGWRALQRAGRRTLSITAQPAGEAMRVRFEWH